MPVLRTSDWNAVLFLCGGLRRRAGVYTTCLYCFTPVGGSVVPTIFNNQKFVPIRAIRGKIILWWFTHAMPPFYVHIRFAPAYTVLNPEKKIVSLHRHYKTKIPS